MPEHAGKSFRTDSLSRVPVRQRLMIDGQDLPMVSRLVYASLWVLVLIIPLENMFVFEGVGTITRFIGAFCMAMALIAVIIEKRGRRLGGMQAAFGVFLLWSMATFLWTLNYEQSQKAIVTLSQLFAFVWLIWEFAQDERHQRGLMRAYVFGAMISVWTTVNAFIQGQATYYMRYSTRGFDPNDLGLTLALAVPMAWYLALHSEGRWSRWLYRLYLPASFMAVGLTASRSAFIAMLIGSVYVFWSAIRLSIMQRVVLWAAIVAGAWGVLQFIPKASWLRLATIGAELTSGSLGGRVGIWRDGLRIFLDNPLCGVGVGAFRSGLLLTQRTYEAAPHNLFLSILVGQGLIGLLLFFQVLFSAMRGLGSMPVLTRRMWLVVLLTWATGVMTLGWEMRKPTWLILGLLAVMGSVPRPHDDSSLEEVPL
jgi:O-antigen ligase